MSSRIAHVLFTCENLETCDETVATKLDTDRGGRVRRLRVVGNLIRRVGNIVAVVLTPAEP